VATPAELDPAQPRRRLLTLVSLLPGLAACSARVIPAGLAVGEPNLSAQHLTMADGARLPFRAWLPADPPHAVLLGLHGFGDYSRNAFEIPAPLLTAQGLALYAYDQRGFGAAPHPGIWAGTATLVADAVAVTRLVRARHPGVPVFLMGESMGVAVLLVAATEPEPPPADGYILLAPAVRGRASMNGFMRGALEVAVHTIPAVGFRGSAPGYAPTDSEEAMRRWSQDPLTAKEFRVDAVYGLVDLMDAAVAAAPHFRAPTLLVYGAKDAIIRPAPMRAALRRFPAGAPQRFAYYAEGYHQLLRDRNRAVVVQDIAAWVSDRDAPLPSGADAAGAAWLAAGDRE
jgi:acylglycerol lipase